MSKSACGFRRVLASWQTCVKQDRVVPSLLDQGSSVNLCSRSVVKYLAVSTAGIPPTVTCGN
jgi:hypothetical protein